MTDKQIKDPCDKCDVEPPAMKFKCPECEHNPDKEQIIVDGFDVSACEHLGSQNNCMIRGHMPCFCFPNCYYKLLQRKTEECEKQKDKRAKTSEEFIHATALYNRYRKAIEKIEEIVSGNYETLDPLAKQQIQNILNKAKEEE